MKRNYKISLWVGIPLLVFVGGVFTSPNSDMADMIGIGKYVNKRKDMTSKCDFSYYSDYKELAKCVSKNYPPNSDFASLEMVLKNEGYDLSLNKKNGFNTHNAILGRGRLSRLQILTDEKDGKIISVKINP